MNARLLERLKVVVGAVPIDTTGAAVTGDYVNMKSYRRLLIVIEQGAWAGGTPAVTLKQATDVAASGEKALSFSEYWQGTALTDDTYARTAVVSDTFNLPATANTVTLIEVHQQDLDLNNSFSCVRVNIASPGSNADLVSVTYILGDPEHTSKPETHISAIV
jgi:hypothetical protein